MSESSVPFRHPWPERMFGEVGSVTVGGTPSTSVPEFWGGAIPWMASGDVHSRVIDDVPTRISGLGLRHSSSKVVDPPSVAVALAGQGRTRGTAAYVRCALCTNQSVALLKGNPGELDAEYLLHNLSFRYSELRSRSAGGGRAGLTKTILNQFPLPLPAVPEQSKIAEVLSAMARAIEETEALIVKQQRIKTGLTQDLLTRGIDENGNLRSQKTHKFKESPLGRIPVEWNCMKLHQVLVQRPRNGLYKAASLIGRGTLLVGQTSFTQDRRLDFSLCRRAVVSPSEIETFGLVFGDILVTRVFATVEGIGQPVLVDSPPEPAVYESNMLLLRPSASMIDSLLLFTWLRSEATRRRVLRSANASNQVSVNQAALNSLPVPVPSFSEQKRISQALGQLDAAVRCTDVTLQKLRLLKTGLMQDLLTGNRRVTALLEQREEVTT
ncbi:hypothetical protein F4X86_01705 [Candidatus Saccharibacteria bacterium]|nr:hypothetical protein [Gammaproteobacteria bacterium]MYB39996.1 hypothetical protein [Candidatus Saccharibacteria bacterium]